MSDSGELRERGGSVGRFTSLGRILVGNPDLLDLALGQFSGHSSETDERCGAVRWSRGEGSARAGGLPDERPLS